MEVIIIFLNSRYCLARYFHSYFHELLLRSVWSQPWLEVVAVRWEPPTVSNNNGTEYGEAPEYWLNTPYLIHIVECFYLAYILIVKYTTLILVWC